MNPSVTRAAALRRKKMSSSTPEALTAAVLTVSDSCARGERTDLSGPAVAEALKKGKFSIIATEVVADDQSAIQKSLLRLATNARLVVTTGGTGIAERDVTPEATKAICDRLLEGVAERMRAEGAKKTPFAALSRAVCGIRGKSLILNLPGSPRGAVESLEAVIDMLPHALQLLSGNTEHSYAPGAGLGHSARPERQTPDSGAGTELSGRSDFRVFAAFAQRGKDDRFPGATREQAGSRHRQNHPQRIHASQLHGYESEPFFPLDSVWRGRPARERPKAYHPLTREGSPSAAKSAKRDG